MTLEWMKNCSEWHSKHLNMCDAVLSGPTNSTLSMPGGYLKFHTSVADLNLKRVSRQTQLILAMIAKSAIAKSQ